MTILYPKLFNRHLPAGYDGKFDWDYLKGAFPRGCMPMDLDALNEFRREFLFFETKDRGVEISEGQRRTIQSLLSLGMFTCIFQRGKLAPEEWAWGRLCHVTGKIRWSEVIAARAEDIWRFVHIWSTLADSGVKGNSLGLRLEEFFNECKRRIGL